MTPRTNLMLDTVIAGAFLLAANPPVAGLAVHEWFGLAFGAALVAHIVLHWDWVVSATRRLQHRGSGLRLTYAVDAFLLVALTASVLSGLLTSRHVLPSLGLAPEPLRGWREVHSLATNALIAAMGVHLGLHWKWIAVNVPRLVAMNGWSARSAAPRQENAISGHVLRGGVASSRKVFGLDRLGATACTLVLAAAVVGALHLGTGQSGTGGAPQELRPPLEPASLGGSFSAQRGVRRGGHSSALSEGRGHEEASPGHGIAGMVGTAVQLGFVAAGVVFLQTRSRRSERQRHQDGRHR
jgi:hypothetical protein